MLPKMQPGIGYLPVENMHLARNDCRKIEKNADDHRLERRRVNDQRTLAMLSI